MRPKITFSKEFMKASEQDVISRNEVFKKSGGIRKRKIVQLLFDKYGVIHALTNDDRLYYIKDRQWVRQILPPIPDIGEE